MSSKHELSVDPGIAILNPDHETKQNIIEGTLLYSNWEHFYFVYKSIIF
jgi:hypothetical protein